MKPRVLIVGVVVPAANRGGGCLALHRHFIERDDFTVAVASQNACSSSCPEQFEIRPNPIWARAKRTRMSRWLENVHYLTAGSFLPAPLLEFARKWQPDLIFSVADDLDAPVGFRLARRLRIPFALNFQDLFAFSPFHRKPRRPFHWVRSLLVRRYHYLHDRADAVFHTSEGMRAWFGPAARGDVLYPLGGFEGVSTYVEALPPVGRLTLIYAGNCYGPAGKMLLELARRLEAHPQIALEIYTMGNDWSASDVEHFTQSGVYRGFLPFKQLRDEFARADAFLTTMSFQPDDRTFVETSFTSKWLDYVPYGKPIFVWAPPYSSAIRFAAETGAGIVVDVPEPEAVMAAIKEVMADTERWTQTGRAAARVAANELNAERLHGLLCERLGALVAGKRSCLQNR
jgi:glycosyltransferase involved in cell wall biosynthesis